MYKFGDGGFNSKRKCNNKNLVFWILIGEYYESVVFKRKN